MKERSENLERSFYLNKFTMDIVYTFDLIGTFVFAISGILAALEKKFDLVGAAVLGFVTAVGGGTLRDVMLGATPVAWMKDLNYFIVIIFALPLCYLGRKYIIKLRKGIFLFDTIGIAVFTIIGVQKTLNYNLSPVIAILLGVVSAVFGGVLRDVLSNKVPLIFRKEIYASACLIGGALYLFFEKFIPNSQLNIILAILVVFLIRYLSIKLKWSINFKPLN